jgi:outer membrane receptor protein involved in Fe transport
MSKIRTHFTLLAVCFVAVVLSVATSPLLAQGATATMSGKATDTTGAVLPGVEITVTNVDTGQSRLAITGDEGRYNTPELGVGNYEVRAELAGFQTGVRRGIQLAVGQEAVVDFTMQIGAITEEVVVTGEAPLVNTTSSTLSDVINEAQVHDLPLNSRDLTQLSLLSPGVSRIYTSISGGVIQGAASVRLSVGGARTYSTGFLLDGSDVTDVSRGIGPGGAAGAMFGVETVKEFQVITNNFSAEYGRFVGGVMSMVTKSGTNEVHGSVFYFHRNDNMDARNFFDRDTLNPTTRSSTPEFKRHQYGATIGGPIVQDKTFGFFSYEGFRQGQGLSLRDVVPSVNAKQGLFPDDGSGCSTVGFGATLNASGQCQVSVNPLAQPFIDLYPDGNGLILDPTGLAQAQELLTVQTQPTTEDFFTGRLDHNFSDSDSIFGRYTIQDGERENAVDGQNSSLPHSATFLANRNQYFTTEWKHIFSPSTINTARVGFSRNTWSEEPLVPGPLSFGWFPDAPMGRLEMQGSFTALGLWVNGRNVSNGFTYVDDVSMTRGQHDLKIGINVGRYQVNDFTDGFRDGRYRFAGSSLRLITGQPSSWDGKVPGAVGERGIRQTVLGVYIQDDFKWKPNFTANLGLRFEYAGTPTEVNDRISNLDNPLTDDFDSIRHPANPIFENPSGVFAPRIGFAWDPFGDGKTSIRAGAGIFFETVLPYHYSQQIRRSPPDEKTSLISGASNQAELAAAFPGPPLSSLLPRTLNFHKAETEPAQPLMNQWNFTIQREVTAQVQVTASYVGSKGTNLYIIRNINAAEPEVLPDGRNLWRSGLSRRNTNFSDINHYEYSSDSAYHGLQLSARKRFSAGLQFQLSYTFGRSIDNNSRVNFSDLQDNLSAFPADNYSLSTNRGLSTHDVRNNFSFNFVYELPKMDMSGASGALLNGWQLNGIVSLSTGNPLHIRHGVSDWNRDRANPGGGLSERPSLRAGADNSPVLSDGREPQQYFDPTVFVSPDRGFTGDLGRNTLMGPGVATFDFSLFKNTALTEQVGLQFRAEFFNLFNRANFASPGRSSMSVFSGVSTTPIDCSTYGAAPGPGCDQVNVATYNANAGVISKTTTTSRQIQLGLRLLF